MLCGRVAPDIEELLQKTIQAVWLEVCSVNTSVCVREKASKEIQLFYLAISEDHMQDKNISK